MDPIRVLSLNIWNYNEPWPDRLALIGSLIARTSPDLVALQEIRFQSWSALPHQADQILDKLRQLGADAYHMIWQPAAYWSKEDRGKQYHQNSRRHGRLLRNNNSLTCHGRPPRSRIRLRVHGQR